ncbi:mucin-2-like [Prinia subflava]|uniref:mucin-2-like n=1 Tax=Prinia subflava TaxID=208062 RepID=UPI002FE0E66A
MAGQRWLVAPARGLLLCILALQLCLQGSLATAGHSTAANTMVMATKNTSVATKSTSAATKNALVGAVTTKKASLVAVTTKSTSVATQKAAVVAVTKTAMVVATTKNAAVVTTANTSAVTKNTAMIVKATKNALAATKNTSVVAMATKNTPAATKNTSVVTMATKNTPAATKNTSVVTMATKNTPAATKNTSVVTMATKNTPAATRNTSVVTMATKNTPAATRNTSVVAVTNNAMVVATNNASLLATNTSMKGAEETMQTCQSFQCSGERCYQDEAHANGTTTCHNETHCELYRFSSTNYTARCSSGCSAQPCSANGSASRQQCTLECCTGPLCLQLNASAYGDLPPTTTVPPTTTTPRPPPQNGKVCAAFSCHGNECFKGMKTITKCILGQDFCEMKKTGSNYMAGCSKACKAAKPVCASGVKAACYQECCPATPKASCLKLDGKVHVNSAGQVALAPLLKGMACGVVLLLSYRASTSLWG